MREAITHRLSKTIQMKRIVPKCFGTCMCSCFLFEMDELFIDFVNRFSNEVQILIHRISDGKRIWISRSR